MAIVSIDIPVSEDNADAILRFLPMFRRRDFDPGAPVVDPGVMPYWRYSGKVLEFIKALYDNRWVVNFDWVGWQAAARRYGEYPELIALAGVDEVRRMLTFHARKDRFCDGHLAVTITSGQMAVILDRIAELRRAGALAARD